MPKTTAKKLTHSEYADNFDRFCLMNNVIRAHAESVIGSDSLDSVCGVVDAHFVEHCTTYVARYLGQRSVMGH